VLPTLGKANVGFVVAVVVAGVCRVLREENFGGRSVGGVGMVKKLGTIGLVAVVEDSGFMVGAGTVVAPGLAKKFGTAGWVGAGTVVEGVGATVGVANKFFAGSLVSVVVVVVPVVGFGCVGTAEEGVNKLGVVALVAEVVIASLGGIARAGEGFFSVPFWS